MVIRETLRRAFSSFLAIPTAVIAGFILLALAANAADRAELRWLEPFRAFMHDHVFADPAATSNLLATIAGGVITITSITFSLLLLALQQSASSLTHEIFDQFLQRRLNQFYFGFFVGLALYTLIILATVDPPFNPVYGATLAEVLVIAALYMLLLLLYSTISQMRPVEIIRAIHDHTLQARKRQLAMIARTRRAPRFTSGYRCRITASDNGYIGGIDLDRIAESLAGREEASEIVYIVSIGAYVAYGDPVAEVSAGSADAADELARLVEETLLIERDRELNDDPAYGIAQLETIAWRSVSTSQQNPSPGIAVIQSLRDLLVRFVQMPAKEQDDSTVLPVVYEDNVIERLIGTFENLGVVASEAMQPQTVAAIIRSFALTFNRMPATVQDQIEDVILRSLSALGDFVLTTELDAALADLGATLEQADRLSTAIAIRTARNELAASLGQLNSRSTRVPAGG